MQLSCVELLIDSGLGYLKVTALLTDRLKADTASISLMHTCTMTVGTQSIALHNDSPAALLTDASSSAV